MVGEIKLLVRIPMWLSWADITMHAWLWVGVVTKLSDAIMELMVMKLASTSYEFFSTVNLFNNRNNSLSLAYVLQNNGNIYFKGPLSDAALQG